MRVKPLSQPPIAASFTLQKEKVRPGASFGGKKICPLIFPEDFFPWLQTMYHKKNGYGVRLQSQPKVRLAKIR